MFGITPDVVLAQGKPDTGTCAQRAERMFVGGGFTVHMRPGGELQQPEFPDNQLDLARRGRGFVFDAGIPLRDTWSLRVFGSAAQFRVKHCIYDGTSIVELSEENATTFRLRRVVVGLMNHSPEFRRFCGYSVLSDGVYRLSHAGMTSQTYGGGGSLGFGIPFTRWDAVAVEFHAEFLYPPDPDLVFNWSGPIILGFSAGIRHRF